MDEGSVAVSVSGALDALATRQRRFLAHEQEFGKPIDLYEQNGIFHSMCLASDISREELRQREHLSTPHEL